MPEVSDVELMELADGTLAEPRRGVVEVELSRYPELRQRFEAFRATGKALARLFDPVMEAPLPHGLLHALQESEAASTPRVFHLVSTPAPERRRRRLDHVLSPNRWSLFPGMAWAAGLAAVIGLGVVIWDLPNGKRDETAPFSQALETIPSGQVASITLADRGPGHVKTVLSFLHVDGRHCRQYVMSFERGRGLAGYACRIGHGQWHVEKEVETAASAATKRDEIRPAGPPPEVGVIDDAVGTVIRGDALEKTAELALIRGGWPAEARR